MPLSKDIAGRTEKLQNGKFFINVRYNLVLTAFHGQKMPYAVLLFLELTRLTLDMLFCDQLSFRPQKLTD
jgi:hypothetical protein